MMPVVSTTVARGAGAQEHVEPDQRAVERRRDGPVYERAEALKMSAYASRGLFLVCSGAEASRSSLRWRTR